MRNIKLTIEYDGLDFNGWQKQKDKPNIQGVIENAIKKITNEDVELIGSGRTDSNVHALGQVANFKTSSNIPIEKMAIAINSNLRKSIRIIDAKEVDENFNSRKSAKRKTYKYVINTKSKSAIFRNLELYYDQYLDVGKINEALNYLIGTHDFKAFKSSGGSVKSSIRTIYDAKAILTSGYTSKSKDDKDYVEIYITANGFLYNMVRIIVGTVLDVGCGKITPEEFNQILDSKDRTKASKTAPAHGLYLDKVEY